MMEHTVSIRRHTRHREMNAESGSAPAFVPPSQRPGAVRSDINAGNRPIRRVLTEAALGQLSMTSASNPPGFD
jgi:hypothetical protein